ncbi:hypothetical protein KC19_6G019800 [Ceratodon purpureus]|uniref:Uncharacterized protein n=1 Tax=Ceratodon purpureus TaxID=3225 RepID=A0A8T0HDD0_CERPU|nr:hypothetical protein KC19_6G019800 [Ceratodon purpureus]
MPNEKARFAYHKTLNHIFRCPTTLTSEGNFTDSMRTKQPLVLQDAKNKSHPCFDIRPTPQTMRKSPYRQPLEKTASTTPTNSETDQLQPPPSTSSTLCIHRRRAKHVKSCDADPSLVCEGAELNTLM